MLAPTTSPSPAPDPDLLPAVRSDGELTPTDQLLWHHACCWMAKDDRVVPGYAEIVEHCGTIPPAEEHHSRFALRLAPDRHGRPAASRITLPGEPRAPRRCNLITTTQALLDRLEEAVTAVLPLHSHDLDRVRLLARTGPPERRCAVFGTERQADGLEFEFRLWIDTRHGHATRIDYHARGLPSSATGIATASAQGSRRYRLDPRDHWLLTHQHERLTFWAAALDLPARGFAERTTTYSEHWQTPHSC